MNRQEAIFAAQQLRKGTTVYTLSAERKPYIAAVKAMPEVLNKDGSVKNATVEAVEEQKAEPRRYDRQDFTFINAAKHAMRCLGHGVALKSDESLPQ